MQQPQQGEPRNLGEEVVVAIVALAVIAFAFAFGVVVSVVNDAPEPATATPIVTLATLPPTATIDFTPFATFTREASPTHTSTRTASPTATVAATLTATPSPTHTATRTASPTATDAVTLTATPSPTHTATRTASPTATDAATLTATPSPTHTATLTATPSPTQTATITPSPTRVPLVVGCEEAAIASIDGIVAGQVLRGLVEIEGTASHPRFRRYVLAVRPADADDYVTVFAGNTPVVGRVLGVLDAGAYPAGLALLRLEVVTDDGAVGLAQVCVIPVVLSGR